MSVILPQTGVLRDRVLAALRRLTPLSRSARTHLALYDAEAPAATGTMQSLEFRPQKDLGWFVGVSAALAEPGSGVTSSTQLAAELYANGRTYGEGQVRARAVLGEAPQLTNNQIIYCDWAAPIVVKPGQNLGVKLLNENGSFSGNKVVARFEGFHVTESLAQLLLEQFGEFWAGSLSLATTASATESVKELAVKRAVHVRSVVRDPTDIATDGAVDSFTVKLGGLSLAPNALKHTAGLPFQSYDDTGRLDVTLRATEVITARMQAAATRAVQLTFLGSARY